MSVPRRVSRRAAVFEMLEPRILLSADAMPAPVDLTVTLSADRAAIVVLDNQQAGAEVQRVNLDGPRPLVIAGTAGDDTFRIDLDPTLFAKNRIIISGGLGEDRIVGPDGGASWALDKTGKGYVGNIAFGFIENLVASDGGHDTLSGPYGGAVWTVDGEG
ncbi:MAG: LEPR-XLL domain-containing protein, partial [Burkholderiales bacterium]|nr:LEPR-XLL domain-containing protein [Burkholderiales bacterium]